MAVSSLPLICRSTLYHVVPVLGPLLYILCTVDICHVVERHNLRLQVYTSVAVGDVTSAVHSL